ncbi:hypothetical protein [Spirillospora sp. NBC_01491]|uniref:hypothetical protein n=1 Tax=Spirillospora sp. NBC_01491 TaxID=2976007 RepID=UPI002E332EA6|nr:hypothetical protein [Spirillospora sp. NBC_01491]
MAESSWPDPADGRTVDEIQYEQLAAHFTEDGFYMDPNGVFIDTAGGPVYADGTARAVKMRAGKYASVRGFGWTAGASDVPLTIAENTSGTVRVDRVALELDRSDWTVRAVVVTGSPGSGAPTLTRDEGPTGLWQVPVARVTVASGASVINLGDLWLEGHRVGSRVRAWPQASDMLFPKLGELGFAEDTRSWFGWNGSQRVSIYEDTGWVNLSTNGPDGGAWTNNSVSRIRRVNRSVHLRVAVARWSTNGLSTSDPDGSVPFILPAQFRPSVQEVGAGFHDRAPTAVRIETDGSVRIFPLSVDIPAGRTVQASVDYMV